MRNKKGLGLETSTATTTNGFYVLDASITTKL